MGEAATNCSKYIIIAAVISLKETSEIRLIGAYTLKTEGCKDDSADIASYRVGEPHADGGSIMKLAEVIHPAVTLAFGDTFPHWDDALAPLHIHPCSCRATPSQTES